MFNKADKCRLSDTEVESQANTWLQQMSTQEKVDFLNGNWNPLWNQIRLNNSYNPKPIATNGNKRLGIAPIAFTDGPRGVVMGNSTCFPVSMARGASFDRELERRVGDVIGKESRAQGANLFAGVCINLLRHPAWGRAQETYSEDPYHLGEMGKALTEAVQDHNVMACLKHYALNNIENTRFKVNVEVDERSLHEIYLPHFKKSVDAGAASLMGAYNLVRGDQACESDYLLNTVLRDQWGFDGFTLSDFLFGIRNTAKAINSGMDLEMPMPIQYSHKLKKAVDSGEVSMETLNTAVLRIMRALIVFENTPDPTNYDESLVAHPDHIALAREVAEKSMVLLKNEKNVLPFSKDVKRVLVVGHLAKEENTGDHGSSRIYAPYVITPLKGIQKYLGAGVDVQYCDESDVATATKLASEVDAVIIIAGHDYNDEGEFIIFDDGEEVSANVIVEGYKNQGMPVTSFLMKLMMGNLKRSYTVGDDESVGGDRESLSLKQKEIKLIKAIGRINPNTVVSLVGGSTIMTHEWDDDVPAILMSWYSGMEGGTALSRILFGDVNPSGKLPFSVPTDQSHLPYFSSTDLEITYDFYHGYTLLNKNNIDPAYAFGFGLSYTDWTYGDVSLAQNSNMLDVMVQLTNSGQQDGAEVVQVYVGMKDSQVERQPKLLKGFSKIELNANQSERVTIHIPLDELRYYDVTSREWILEKGKYQIYVGSSSRNSDLVMREIVLS